MEFRADADGTGAARHLRFDWGAAHHRRVARIHLGGRPGGWPHGVRHTYSGRVHPAAAIDGAGMNRLDATRRLLAVIADRPGMPVVASLGHPAYDLSALADRPANFYQWGSMGLASSM